MINRRFDSKVRGMINLGGPPVFCARPPFRYRGIPLVHYSSREAFKFVSSNTEIPGQEKPGEERFNKSISSKSSSNQSFFTDRNKLI